VSLRTVYAESEIDRKAVVLMLFTH